MYLRAQVNSLTGTYCNKQTEKQLWQSKELSVFNSFSYICSNHFLSYLFTLTRFYLWKSSTSNNLICLEEEENEANKGSSQSQKCLPALGIQEPQKSTLKICAEEFILTRPIGCSLLSSLSSWLATASFYITQPLFRNLKDSSKFYRDNSQLLTCTFPVGSDSPRDKSGS